MQMLSLFFMPLFAKLIESRIVVSEWNGEIILFSIYLNPKDIHWYSTLFLGFVHILLVKNTNSAEDSFGR